MPIQQYKIFNKLKKKTIDSSNELCKKKLQTLIIYITKNTPKQKKYQKNSKKKTIKVK